MKSRNCSVFAFLFGAIAALAASPLSAQTRVGEAAVVMNEVLRVAGSATSRINVGDGLLRNEIVRTGLDSAARLVMSDSTNLSLGAHQGLGRRSLRQRHRRPAAGRQHHPWRR